MSLNPIVALSEQLQKLINEHGSAAILRDHLAMFKDQVSSLEKDNLRLVNEIGAYKINDEKLTSDIDHLKKENDILRKKIQEYEQGFHSGLQNNSRMKWGCLVFDEDDKLYCPSCFHKNGKKIETSRVNSKTRYCAVCKSNLPAG